MIFDRKFFTVRSIWIPSVLLVLLLLFCTWKHRDSFDNPLHYTIVQKSGRYYLKGALQSQESVNRLKTKFAENGAILNTEETELNALLVPRGSLSLVEKIIPDIVSYCHQAVIAYRAEVLTISGIVESEDKQREIDRFLQDKKILVKNETIVVTPQEIQFVITQRRKGQYLLEGDFSTLSQQDKLLSLFETKTSSMQVHPKEVNPQLRETKRVIKKLELFIPFFISRVDEGELRYQKGVLAVAGKVRHEKEIRRADNYLSKMGVETKNELTLDMKAIKGKKAKRKAKKLLEALQKQRAKKAAVKEAQKEVSRDIVAMMDAKKGEQGDLLMSDNSKVRQNLQTLFETEVIKFHAAETTLTPLGLGTVSKIAVILKTYPSVKIEIAGHTDSDGDDAFNMLLSQGRVNNVKRALMKEGIAKERINAVGYGETKPLFPNTTQENKEKNRRVEIIVEGE